MAPDPLTLVSAPNVADEENEVSQDQVVAVGLLTEQDLTVLGQGFGRAYRLDCSHHFHDLLAAIDLADRNQATALRQRQK
jgi:hypothetical protein